MQLHMSKRALWISRQFKLSTVVFKLFAQAKVLHLSLVPGNLQPHRSDAMPTSLLTALPAAWPHNQQGACRGCAGQMPPDLALLRCTSMELWPLSYVGTPEALNWCLSPFLKATWNVTKGQLCANPVHSPAHLCSSTAKNIWKHPAHTCFHLQLLVFLNPCIVFEFGIMKNIMPFTSLSLTLHPISVREMLKEGETTNGVGFWLLCKIHWHLLLFINLRMNVAIPKHITRLSTRGY